MKKAPAAENVAPLHRRRPSQTEAEDAVRTLLAWAGDDPAREGLLDTPRRVAQAYGEYFAGYAQSALAELSTGFEETTGYDDMIMLTGIHFESHCEHHIAPFSGTAHVAYIPSKKIAGLSKIARVVEIYARRLQTQEALTSDVALAIEKGLEAKGVGVLMTAEHRCVSMRGVRQHGVTALTSRFLGRFGNDEALRARFVSLAQTGRAA